MIVFFKTQSNNILAVQSTETLSANNIEKLVWLFDNATLLNENIIEGSYIGPRREMI